MRQLIKNEFARLIGLGLNEKKAWRKGIFSTFLFRLRE
ncbi:hypothetical protein SD77_3208 [Bacillus badius]|uniref:Uncharacterized protein n=1 Tax=Bacillus badius TaxID=1455 RepID=A0ABR5AX68_BACBA|nr:hypothetical protein SD77_3208 [Bacillus badius]